MLYLVKMMALRPLTGDGYQVTPGQTFTTNNRHAEKLEARGVAYRYFERPVYKAVTPLENKMLPPVENKSAVVEHPVNRQQRRRTG